MKTSAKPSKTEKSEKGGKFLPAFCSFLGTLIILLVICIALTFVLPGLLGYEIYTVVSGSMEPALPTGSAVFVKYAAPETIELGEIVAYMDGSEPVTHRVIENHMVEHGYDPAYGARPIKRLMQRELVNLLAKSILEGSIHKNSAVTVDVSGGEVVVR